MSSPEAVPDQRRRGPRPLTVIVLLAVGLLAVIAASAFLPRWWSHRVADHANGSFVTGIGLGLFYGFVFTLLALIVLSLGAGKVKSWKARLILLAIALLVTTPNLLTLGIVLGPGNAAHAGERTLDVEAPGFRASSLIGAVAAVLAIGSLRLLLRSRRRSREDAAALRKELEAERSPDSS
jgi:MFS family permease